MENFSATTIEIISGIATVIAITGVVLNNHKSRWCFVFWLFSNALTAGLHVHSGLWMLTLRDVIFFALAIYGMIAWGRPLKTNPNSEISRPGLSDKIIKKGVPDCPRIPPPPPEPLIKLIDPEKEQRSNTPGFMYVPAPTKHICPINQQPCTSTNCQTIEESEGV